MPGQDQTGPMGRGPLTGRGLGPCGRGFARGRGFGRGFAQPFAREYTKEDELADLKAEKELIERDIEAISARIKELSTKK